MKMTLKIRKLLKMSRRQLKIFMMIAIFNRLQPLPQVGLVKIYTLSTTKKINLQMIIMMTMSNRVTNLSHNSIT